MDLGEQGCMTPDFCRLTSGTDWITRRTVPPLSDSTVRGYRLACSSSTSNRISTTLSSFAVSAERNVTFSHLARESLEWATCTPMRWFRLTTIIFKWDASLQMGPQ